MNKPGYRNFILFLMLAALFTSFRHVIQDRWVAPPFTDTLKNPYQMKWGERIIPQAVLDDGEQTYNTYCSSCHGRSGTGEGAPGMTFTIKPANFHDNVVKAQKDGALFWKISEGRGAMPSYRSSLSDDKRWRLVAYLRYLQSNPSMGKPDKNLVSPANFKIPPGSQSAYFPLPERISNVYKSELQHFMADTVLRGLERPWSMAFLPDNTVLIAERNGGLRRVTNGKLEAKPLEGDVPKELRDIKLHPDFKTNKQIYISYYQNPVKPDGGYTVLMRAKLEGNRLTEPKILYKAGPFRQGSFWYGSKIAFDNKGFLYFTVGISGDRKNAQDLSVHSGKTIRLKDDGTIPADNPFVGRAGALPEIFSFGHRMHEGLVFDKKSQKLFSTEFGELGGDELNIIKAGKNYGWPEVTFSMEYTGKQITPDSVRSDVETPIGHWKMAPSDLDFVYGGKYPQWEGNLFIGGIFDKYLQRTVLKNDKVVHTEPLLRNIGRIRDVKLGADKYLYVLTEDNGLLVRLLPVYK